MKNLYNLEPKAYKEGYDLIKMLPDASQRKIPEYIWKYFKENMDLNHTITAEDIEKNNLLEDTNLLLAIIYKTYLASEEEKKIINAKENSIKKKKQKIAYEKYNPNCIFKNKKGLGTF